MTIFEQLLESFRGQEGETFSTSEIKKRLWDRYGTNPSSVIPSDYCYNRRNAGITFSKHLFQFVERGSYLYRGPGHAYSGPVFARPRGTGADQLVGTMVRGEYLAAPSKI